MKGIVIMGAFVQVKSINVRRLKVLSVNKYILYNILIIVLYLSILKIWFWYQM